MSSLLRIRRVWLQNFRGFEKLELSLEADTTVLFADNGGGKSTLLRALAMGLGLLQPKDEPLLALDASRDARRLPAGPPANNGVRQPAGLCRLEWEASFGDDPFPVVWSDEASPTTAERRRDIEAVSHAIARVRQPSASWPLIGFYGTNRLSRRRAPGRKQTRPPDRMDAYSGCLKPSTTDGPLLDWMQDETYADLQRLQRQNPERGLISALRDALVRATPGLEDIWHDPAIKSPIARFSGGQEAAWDELSDGFHVFLGLIGDIARRAAILNAHEGADAIKNVEGIVLIDEVDLHLHPRWQRTVLEGLRRAFPKLQLVITTHSPQVLASALNRQVRHLKHHAVETGEIHVEGRDTNAILRDEMDVDDRPARGIEKLRALHAAIDGGLREHARELLEELQGLWGTLDPALVRAEAFLDDRLSDED